MELQKLAKRAFPGLVGKDLDQLSKGQFFQAPLPKWQRKLGAPKTGESFEELYGTAKMAECHDRQYIEAAEERQEVVEKDKDKEAEKKGSENRLKWVSQGTRTSHRS